MNISLQRAVALLLWLQAGLSLSYAVAAVIRGYSGDIARDLVIASCFAGLGLGVWKGYRFGVGAAAAVSAVELVAPAIFFVSLIVYRKLQFIGLGVVEPLYSLALFALPTLVLCVVTLATANAAGTAGRVPGDSTRS